CVSHPGKFLTDQCGIVGKHDQVAPEQHACSLDVLLFFMAPPFQRLRQTVQFTKLDQGTLQFLLLNSQDLAIPVEGLLKREDESVAHGKNPGNWNAKLLACDVQGSSHKNMSESLRPPDFQNISSNPWQSDDSGVNANLSRFDFRRPDRISKTQLRAIHNLHEALVRNLASSLAAYLRAYLTVSLVSVEQVSY